MSDLLSKSNWMRETMPAKRTRGKRLVLGVGLNDADYVVDPGKSNGVGKCPAYACWMRMLMRGYSRAFQSKNPTYFDVTVCDDWLVFSNFRAWWGSNVVDGWELDKDLLSPGNKQYSPKNCVFVPPWLNRTLNGRCAARGLLPVGVFFHKGKGKFRAQIALGDGRQKTIGDFSSADDAYAAWLSGKISYVTSRKQEIDAIDKRIFSNIIKIIKDIK